MPVINLKDLNGYSLNVYHHTKKPQYFSQPSFNHDMVENLPNYSLREDDILLCSYPKSGCHWLWENVRMLQLGSSKTNAADKEHFMMEASGWEGFQNIDSHASPRLLNNHQFFENQPLDLLKKSIKVFLVYRNPKDVAVSYYHHHKRIPSYMYNGPDFAAYLPRFVDGLVDNNCVFDYLKDWERGISENKINPLILCYEDMHKNPIDELRKISKFLGKEYSDEFLECVQKANTFDSLLQTKDMLYKDKDGPIMYRKGKVGDWMNHFTVAQSEWFDHVARIKMGGSKLFPFKYEV